MNNKEYLEKLIENYKAQNNSTDGLIEYLKQVNSAISQTKQEESQNSPSKAYQKTIGTGKVTGGLNMYPEHQQQNSIFNQQGIVNFFMLGFITLFFEMLFILLSLCIY